MRTETLNSPNNVGRIIAVLPGLGLCIAVTLAASLLQTLETRLFGRAWLEALVIAILLGTTVRTLWTPAERWRPGVEFSAKILLEVAVVLLGATVSAALIASTGVPLLLGIVGVVVLAIAISYGMGRMFGLPHRMATLIACGNSICGNSAIAAVAPVIGADGEDIAASIAFTAILGVVVVLGLPVLAIALHMSPHEFGAFAGLIVYAVPQVLAATAPISSVSAQIGTLVKLVRVLMLGPVVLVLSLITRPDRDELDDAAPTVTAGDRPKRRLPSLHHLVPWFIVGFLLLVAARSMNFIPAFALKPAAVTANWLTVVSMAALGLGVDIRVIARTGLRVTAVVSLSLVALGLIAFALITVLHLD